MHLIASIPRDALAQFCRRRGIQALSLFGSATRDDFGDSSDIDLLVEFNPGVEPSLFDMLAIEEELASIVGRRVDLIERKHLEASSNYIRRKHILNSVESIYVAR
jgi:predicted nucleotidyltransferase